MKLLNFALIKITLCLIAGIVFAYYVELQLQAILVAIAILFLGISGFLIVEKGRLVKSLGFGILALLMFFVIGTATYKLHDQKTFKTHYTQHIDPSKDSVKAIIFRIREVLKPGVYYEKYIVDILQIDAQFVSGKTLLNIEKDSLGRQYKVDDVFLSSSGLKDLIAPLNPDQFNYKAYLKKQYVYHQIFSDAQHLLEIPSDKRSLAGYAASLRRNINTKLKFKNFKPDELALINALLLGQRQDISPEIYDSYTKAGAIHILAVSGLHVGIILLMLNWLFKPLEYLPHGKIIKMVLLVISLWSFAIVAGLSASVTRAVMMFSIVAVGINLKSPANIYNTLVISMFCLLLFKPLFLFDVGFQMSYLAVIAIVSIQPLIVKLWRPKFKPLNNLWQILTVTLAAQLGVLPISLFYFHQFPGLFFVSNLVIIPVLGIILGLGILVIFLGLLNFLPSWLADIYAGIIGQMNSFVRWVSLQERFVFEDISFGLLQVVAAYLLIVSFLIFFKRPNFKGLIIAMIAVLIFQSGLILDKKMNQNEAFIVFHKSRYSMIGIKNSTTMTISHNLDSSTYARDHVIRNYKVGNAIKAIVHDTLQSIYVYNKRKILVVDSTGIYKLPQFRPDYVVLISSPKINMTRLLEIIKPKMIIADGSNYKSYTKGWEASCIKQNVPFHLTGREGAFVITKE